MLQEKRQDKLKAACVRLGISLVVLLFLIYTWLIIIFIFLLFIFFWNKNSKTKIDFPKLLEFLWIFDCAKLVFWEEVFDNDEIKQSPRDYNYLDRMNESIKKNSKIKKLKEIIEKRKRINEFIESKDSYYNNTSIDKFERKTMNKSIIDKKIKKGNINISNSKHSYNDWKSIWDDYESVLDTMKRK